MDMHELLEKMFSPSPTAAVTLLPSCHSYHALHNGCCFASDTPGAPEAITVPLEL